MEKIVISGGPHTGKTTLQNGLRELYPEPHYIEEPATAVIRKAKRDTNYWTDVFSSAERFCELCVDEAVANEAKVPETTETVILDRSLVDTIAYARRDGCDELLPRVTLLARQAIYSTVLFCDFVGEYSNRIETPEEAVRTHEMLRQAYEDLGIQFIEVPVLSVEDRVSLVSSALGSKLTC